MFNIFKKQEVRSDDSLFSDAITGTRELDTSITKEKALQIPCVSETINFISGTIASLPVKMIVNGQETIDYRTDLLNKETGDLLDSNQFKRAFISDMLLTGGGYAYIKKKSNTIIGIYYVAPYYVSISNGTDPIEKAVKILINGREYREWDIMRITRNSLNGVGGLGIVQENPILLNTMFSSMKYEYSTMSSGARRGFLTSEYKLDEDSMNALKRAWNKFTSTDNNSDVMVMNKGIGFQSAQSTATENQLNQSKLENANALRSMLGISDNYDTTFKKCFLPIIAQLESAYNKFLLLESEKDTHEFVIDCSEILKTDTKTRYEAYKTALESGILQIDEVREMENIPPIGLDFVKLSLGDVLYNPRTKEIFTPNTGEQGRLDDMQQSDDDVAETE